MSLAIAAQNDADEANDAAFEAVVACWAAHELAGLPSEACEFALGPDSGESEVIEDDVSEPIMMGDILSDIS